MNKTYKNSAQSRAIEGWIEEYKVQLLSSQKYIAVFRILSNIHDQWVRSNAKKYDRGSEQKSERNIFQHLPIELIGIEEVAKDLAFLAPYLQEKNICVGKFQKQKKVFIPCKHICDEYLVVVKQFLQNNGQVSTKQQLRQMLPNIIANYMPLHQEGEIEEKRLKYMQTKLDVMTEEIVEKQRGMFAK